MASASILESHLQNTPLMKAITRRLYPQTSRPVGLVFYRYKVKTLFYDCENVAV